jgi:hypothetical protein
MCTIIRRGADKLSKQKGGSLAHGCGRSGNDSGFPPPIQGNSYNFRCEAVTDCQVNTVDLRTLIEISLGVASDDFKKMAESYLGPCDLVQLRCANFMSCTLEERLALVLLELSENFGVKESRGTKLTIPARHHALAELVFASRPRVTEFLIQFENNGLSLARKAT